MNATSSLKGAQEAGGNLQASGAASKEVVIVE